MDTRGKFAWAQLQISTPQPCSKFRLGYIEQQSGILDLVAKPMMQEEGGSGTRIKRKDRVTAHFFCQAEQTRRITKIF
jgi:hypothetical protein